MNSQTWYWLGMLASIAVALSGSADRFPDGFWKHVFQIAGVIGTAVNGYLIQRKPDLSNVVNLNSGGRAS